MRLTAGAATGWLGWAVTRGRTKSRPAVHGGHDNRRGAGGGRVAKGRPSARKAVGAKYHPARAQDNGSAVIASARSCCRAREAAGGRRGGVGAGGSRRRSASCSGRGR